MTDAMVRCMQLPGAIAVAFVELKTGRAIAGDGIDNINIDVLTPHFTDFLLPYSNSIEGAPIEKVEQNDMKRYEEDAVRHVVISTTNYLHFLYPLMHEGVGLYLYLALNRSLGNIPLSLRCVVEIDAELRL